MINLYYSHNICKAWTLACVMLLCTSCANGTRPELSEDPPSIQLPEIPDSIRIPSQRADYLITHYWDKLDFNDTLRSHDRPLMEQSFVNFLSILPHASSDTIIEDGFRILIDRSHADRKAFSIVTGLAEEYLNDPHSPMYSEDHFICYLQGMADCQVLTFAQYERVEDRLALVKKNRTGSIAADFSFLKPDGSKSSLKESLPSGDAKLLLIFFDPECDNCENVMTKISSDPDLKRQLEDGALKILAIYSGDNINAWRRKASSLPSQWIVGINDGDVDDGELYYLPSMPTVYLLDSRGTVVKKDLEF